MKPNFVQAALRFVRSWFGIGPKFAKPAQNQSEDKNAPVWCLVANIVENRPYGPQGETTRRGTKHFAAGAKIYCFPVEWGDGYEQIRVIGRQRGSHRFVTMIIKSKWLTNWRAQLVYSPAVIKRLNGAWERAAKYAGTSPETHASDYATQMNEREQASPPSQT